MVNDKMTGFKEGFRASDCLESPLEKSTGSNGTCLALRREVEKQESKK